MIESRVCPDSGLAGHAAELFLFKPFCRVLYTSTIKLTLIVILRPNANLFALPIWFVYIYRQGNAKACLLWWIRYDINPKQER